MDKQAFFWRILVDERDQNGARVATAAATALIRAAPG